MWGHRLMSTRCCPKSEKSHPLHFIAGTSEWAVVKAPLLFGRKKYEPDFRGDDDKMTKIFSIYFTILMFLHTFERESETVVQAP